VGFVSPTAGGPGRRGTPVGTDLTERDAQSILAPDAIRAIDAALAARVAPGKAVAVVGDGAVGLCGVIAAKRLGAEQIIMMGRHPERIALAKAFGWPPASSSLGAHI
jgi:threonine dehydrogenase-like Zn-dependent dehydrogenase